MKRQDDKEMLPGSVALQNKPGKDLTYQRAEKALQQQSQLLRVTLASIGDAVITTDTESLVTMLNPVAETLTGWTQAEAVGRPIAEVFSIVNEDTRTRVASPVERALREGVVAGLANHTILVAKNGREVPIEDSGAPIRDENGAIHGAVLVFRDISERRQAEKVMSRLAAIVESSDDAIISKDLNGIITSWNKGAKNLFGYTAEEIIGKSILTLIPAERAEEEERVLASIRRGEKIVHYETLRRHKDGSLVEISLSVSPLRDETGRIIGASAIARDITARSRADKAVRRLVECSRVIGADFFDAMVAALAAALEVRHVLLCEVNPDAPKRARTIASWADGQPGEPFEYELIGTPCANVINRQTCFYPDGVAAQFPADKLLTEMSIESYLGTPLRAADGSVLGLLAVLHDRPLDETLRPQEMLEIFAGRAAAELERGRNEAALREQTDVVETINSVGQTISAELDLQRVVQTVTDAATDLTGAHFGAFFYNILDEQGASYMLYTLSGVPHEAFAHFPMPRATDLFGPTFRGEGTVRIADVKLDPRYGKNSPYFGMPKGHLPVTSYLAVPVISRSGEVLGGLFFGHPEAGVFNERHASLVEGLAAQAAVAMDNARLFDSLRLSEERFRAIVDQVTTGVAQTDLTGKFTLVNQRYCDIVGYTAEELLNKRMQDLTHPDDLQRNLGLFQRLTTEGTAFQIEKKYVRKDGSEVWVNNSVAPICDSSGKPQSVAAVVLDVSDRKRAEDALRESQQQYEALVWTSAKIVWETNASGAVETDSPTWREFTGQTFDEWKGFGWNDVFHPDDRKRVAEDWQRHVEAKTPVEIEYRVRHKSGQWRWMAARATPILNPDGAVRKWVGMNTDITERKAMEAERERLLAQEQQARVAAEAATRAKDEFLAVLSHELRNPLNSILGYARMVRLSPHNALQVVRNCEIIERNAKVQQQLIEDLLDTARILSGKLKIEAAPTDLRIVVEDALAVVRPAAEAKQIGLVARLGDQPQPIIGDAARLQQVVWNLLQNAIKFTPDGGRVELRMEKNGPEVRITVSDTGKGIEPDFLPAVFDRFSQSDMSLTRRHGGLGLGLALVKQLVELHGGSVVAESAGAGRGATFTLRLPVRAPQLATYVPPVRELSEINTGPAAIPLADVPRLDGLHLLVVDDHEEARRLLAATLGECGATVTAASSGAEALTLLKERIFDMLVCDIAMPDEDGYEVIRRIRELEQKRGVPLAERLPAVALTSLARREDRLQTLSAGFQMHVAKPVELAELVMVIASLIGHRRQAEAMD